jgi:hypothetical protein
MLCAHHIKSKQDRPDLEYDLDNGVTLCSSCHGSLHNYLPECKDKIIVYDDDHFTISEAAKKLGVCKSTLYAWHISGKLVPDIVQKYSKIRYYSRKQIDEFKNSHKKEPAGAYSWKYERYKKI